MDYTDKNKFRYISVKPKSNTEANPYKFDDFRLIIAKNNVKQVVVLTHQSLDIFVKAHHLDQIKNNETALLPNVIINENCSYLKKKITIHEVIISMKFQLDNMF